MTTANPAKILWKGEGRRRDRPAADGGRSKRIKKEPSTGLRGFGVKVFAGAGAAARGRGGGGVSLGGI